MKTNGVADEICPCLSLSLIRGSYTAPSVYTKGSPPRKFGLDEIQYDGSRNGCPRIPFRTSNRLYDPLRLYNSGLFTRLFPRHVPVVHGVFKNKRRSSTTPFRDLSQTSPSCPRTYAGPSPIRFFVFITETRRLFFVFSRRPRTAVIRLTPSRPRFIRVYVFSASTSYER